MFQVRTQFSAVKTAERRGLFVVQQNNFGCGGDGRGNAGPGADRGGCAQRDGACGERAHRGKAAGALARLFGFVRETERAAKRFHRAIRFFAKQTADMADLVVDRFERDVLGHHAWKIILQRRTENAACDSNNKQPHENSRKHTAEMKSSMKENERQREKTEPEMAAHPGLCAPEPPSGNAFTRAEGRSEKHESEADDAER